MGAKGAWSDMHWERIQKLQGVFPMHQSVMGCSVMGGRWAMFVRWAMLLWGVSQESVK